MVNGDIAIIGLPSSGLRRLASSLAIRQIKEDTEIHRSGPDGSLHFAPHSTTAGWARYFDASSSARALLLYRTPWGFLEEQLGKSAFAPSATVQLDSVVKSALDFWHAYHLALSGLRRERAGRILLLNADRPMDLNAVQALLEKRFLLRPGSARAAAEDGAGAASGHEEIFCDMVDTLAPECLELYAGLESCAELMGRKPEFEPGGHARREGVFSDVLRLIARQGTLEKNLASANSQMDPLKTENGLYLLQLQQIQQELERYVKLNRANEIRLADLQRQLESASAQQARNNAQKALGLQNAAGAAVAQSAHSPLRRFWYARKRNRALRKQMLAIRLSGLFDEQWYLKTHPDVAQAGLDPIEHYLKYGASEARNPSTHFDSLWYLEAYPDVAATGMNPLLHFIEFGRNERRQAMRPIA